MKKGKLPEKSCREKHPEETSHVFQADLRSVTPILRGLKFSQAVKESRLGQGKKNRKWGVLSDHRF